MFAVPCLIIRADSIRDDPQIQPGARGDRKIMVTNVYAPKEVPAMDANWHAPAEGEPCPVAIGDDLEFATFTQAAKQDKHMHPNSIEIYTVLGGVMKIDVEGTVYALKQGDTIIVMPHRVHQVHRDGEFLCQVITQKPGGRSNRVLIQD